MGCSEEHIKGSGFVHTLNVKGRNEKTEDGAGQMKSVSDEPCLRLSV